MSNFADHPFMNTASTDGCFQQENKACLEISFNLMLMLKVSALDFIMLE